jgi:hypothetical protein
MTPEEEVARIERVNSAAHELGHALFDRLYGSRVVLLTYVMGHGNAGQTFAHYPQDLPQRDTLAAGLMETEAGDVAVRLLVVTPGLLELAANEPDPATLDAAIARLAPADAADVTADLDRHYPDVQQAEDVARKVAGDDWPELQATLRPIVWREVTAFFPMLLALLPDFLRAGTWTGDDLEEAIAAATAAKEE